MSVEGFILLDEKLRIELYNQQIFDFFLIPAVKDPLEKVQQIILNHTDLNHRIQRLLTSKGKQNIDHFILNSDKTLKEPIQVTAFITGEVAGNRRILTYFSKISDKVDPYTPSMRSLKYNVISKLAPSIAHEIRNPLSSLAIHTEILDNMLPTLSLQTEQFQRIKKSITVLQSEIERITRIIDHFFKLARPGAKESSYEDINSILRESFELIKPQCYEQGIKIELNLEKGIPFVYLNRDELMQVLLNIMINAMESMPRGGVLTIMSKKLENKSLIIIQDDGQGIPPNDLKKIFTRKFSSKDNGSGISLVLARQLIEKMGGKITAQSDPYLGTFFTIELPQASKF